MPRRWGADVERRKLQRTRARQLEANAAGLGHGTSARVRAERSGDLPGLAALMNVPSVTGDPIPAPLTLEDS